MANIDRIKTRLKGHLRIVAYESLEDLQAHHNGIVVFDRDNAVHRENFGLLVARTLADRPDDTIYYMYFGDGGATVDPLGNVILNPPNVTGSADLYNPTFFEIVDQGADAPNGNHMNVEHIAGTYIVDVEVFAIVAKNQPSITDYTFNEIGLKTEDDLLLTHLTFTPITKPAARILEIQYTISIDVNCDNIGSSFGQPLLGVQAISAVGRVLTALGLDDIHLYGEAAVSAVGSFSNRLAPNLHLSGVSSNSAVGHPTVNPNVHRHGVVSRSAVGHLRIIT